MIFNRNTMFGVVAAAALVAPSAFGEEAITVDTDVTAQQLVDRLVGLGVDAFNAKITTKGSQALGFFHDSSPTPIFGFSSGIALSTGSVNNVIGPNTLPDAGQNNQGNGDTDLDVLFFNGKPTSRDATILEFDFICEQDDGLSFEYVFGSDEYNEYVDAGFNDAFAFFLNGVNIALLPDGSPVSINNVNCGRFKEDGSGNFDLTRTENFCQELFVDNTGADQTDTQFDGYTKPLFTNALPPGNRAINSLKIVIADAGDGIYDSAVLLKAGSFICAAPPTIQHRLPSSGGGGQGDPHFKTWRGHHFDFHGECDLVLLQSEAFESGLGLDVHIRTKMRRDISYISSAALRIGSDVLEVESQGVYYLNGVAGAELPSEFSGFEFSHTQPTDKQHIFEVHLEGRERIKIKTFKDFVSVLIEEGQQTHFADSVGLMGDFEYGLKRARDGKTVLEDANAFGQEWQVLDTDPTLFQTVRFPQYPQTCTLPPPKATSMLRRRLSDSSVDELAAEKACAHWGQGKDDCIFDVLATGDLEMAVVGAY
jgi:hypothetical protein